MKFESGSEGPIAATTAEELANSTPNVKIACGGVAFPYIGSSDIFTFVHLQISFTDAILALRI